MKIPWDKLGAKVGVSISLLGLLLIFLGWNGAASFDRLPSQFPYLISGGLGGLALVVLGAAVILVETSREERDRLRSELNELRQAIDALALGSPNGAGPSKSAARAPAAEPSKTGRFVAGETTYHRPDCRLLEGRGELERVDTEDVASRRLAACRVCSPPAVAPAPPSRPFGR